MPAARCGLRIDHLHSERRHGGAVPEAVLESTLEQPGPESGSRGRGDDIGLWAARKRKATWQARFTLAIAKCNARMISRSQLEHITTN